MENNSEATNSVLNKTSNSEDNNSVFSNSEQAVSFDAAWKDLKEKLNYYRTATSSIDMNNPSSNDVQEAQKEQPWGQGFTSKPIPTITQFDRIRAKMKKRDEKANLTTTQKFKKENIKIDHTLDILVPQYKETEKVIYHLLESIQLQEGVGVEDGYDKQDFQVIIANDGTDVILPQEFLNKFTYKITYLKCPHQGVSGTRNTLLDYSTAEYVMWCDADDGFYTTLGIKNILEIIRQDTEAGMNDSEGNPIKDSSGKVIPKTPEQKVSIYNSPFIYYVGGKWLIYKKDNIFVHGKILNRTFLIQNNLRWNPELTVNEDSYFYCLVSAYAVSIKNFNNPFYTWRPNKASITRADYDFVIRSFADFIKGQDALIMEFLTRGNFPRAMKYFVDLIYYSYATVMSCNWYEKYKDEDGVIHELAEEQVEKNLDHKNTCEDKLKILFKKYKSLWDACPQEIKDKTKEQKTKDNGNYKEYETFEEWFSKIENADVESDSWRTYLLNNPRL